MELESSKVPIWEGYVDWRNRPALRGHHGGMRAAVFVLLVEALEYLAFVAASSNLVLYLTKDMHMSPLKSANNVTNFMGTAFLLSLLGGFLCDTFFTTYHVYLMGALIEFLGLIVLTLQACVPSLLPPKCEGGTSCQEVNGGKAAMLFVGLYLVALGVGGIKGSLPTHGGEQFDESTPSGRKQRSTFFNFFVFCLACGGIIGFTFVVWIEDNIGWKWGFAIATLAIFITILVFLAGSATYKNKIPAGSPITTISKVLIAATLNSCTSRNSSNAVVNMVSSHSIPHKGGKESAKETNKASTSTETPSESLKFLNAAVVNKPVFSSLECTVQQVEDVKVVLKLLPIFASTIILNCCLAQLSTFSIEQASTMNTKLGSFKVPPGSLSIFPAFFIMTVAPTYDLVIIPYARKVTKSEMGISHLKRIGIGLVLSFVAMATAAIVEVKRKSVATHSGLLDDKTKPLPISFLWISFQFLFLGSADVFSMAGLLEFLFSEAPASMRSLATSLTWASLAIGFYLSSVIVSVVNSVTSTGSHKPWLSDATGNLNHYHLERFYWLMCVLSGLNFLHYLYCASRYKYRGRSTTNE